MLRRFETNRAPVQKRLKAKNLRDAIKTIHGAELATLLRLGFTTAALRETVLVMRRHGCHRQVPG